MVLFSEGEYLQFELSYGVSWAEGWSIGKYPETQNENVIHEHTAMSLSSLCLVKAPLGARSSWHFILLADFWLQDVFLQETIILDAAQIDDATDTVLKEHAIPAPFSQDLAYLLLRDSSIDEASLERGLEGYGQTAENGESSVTDEDASSNEDEADYNWDLPLPHCRPHYHLQYGTWEEELRVNESLFAALIAALPTSLCLGTKSQGH